MFLNYIENLLLLASVVTGCGSIASLVGFSIGITSSPVGIKICAITAGIKKYKSIINKKKKKHDKILLLVKSKLYSIEALISEALIDSRSSHD